MKRERVRDEKRFETSNLPLASSLLVSVPGIALADISSAPGIDGRRVIILQYPENQEAIVQRVIEDFYRRCLHVQLYPYNQALNRLRDRLHQHGLPGSAIQ